MPFLTKMRRTLALALLTAAGLHHAAATAPATTGNPPWVIYKATIKDAFYAGADLPGHIMGSIIAQAPFDGNGVDFKVFFNNLPVEGGPFTYHIHKKPVPDDGNCTSTLTHLDPYGAGAEVKCNPDAPATCEVGDLSGKHGSVETLPFLAAYNDAYAATNPDDPAYLGNLSFVVHYANSTRIACANFAKVDFCSPPWP